MIWRRRRGPRSGEIERDEPGAVDPERVVRAAPGIGALFDGVREDGSHIFLDLGTATEPHLRLYSGYARQIRFAGLLPNPPHGEGLERVLDDMPPNREEPYDMIVAWDILDRLIPEERPILMERLAQLTSPGARLYTVVRASGKATLLPTRFVLMDLERVAHEVVGPPEPAGHELLPAEVERVLAPFRVSHAFTLRAGMREYVAVKQVRGMSKGL